MNRPTIFAWLLLLIAGAGVEGVKAQISGKEPPIKPLDDRVVNQLTRARLMPYAEITNLNDFRVAYKKVNGKRLQRGFVNSNTEKYLGLETREIWSVAMVMNAPLSAKIANRLLSDDKKFGSWRVSHYRGRYTLYFATHVAADCDSQTLRDALDFVIGAADSMELELTGKDEY